MKGELWIDTGADTTCVGRGFTILNDTGRSETLRGYSDRSNAQQSVPIVSAATAALDGRGDTVILILNEALNLGQQQQTSLLNLNQVRYAGNRADDVPHFLPGDSIFGIDTPDGDHIPFRLKGRSDCIIDVRTPTTWEMENCKHIQITSAEPWDSKANDWANIESTFNGN